MRIEDYFDRAKETVNSSAIVHLSSVTYDKRSSHIGFIRGRLTLIDGSVLDWREFVDVEIAAERLMYVYQYMDAHNEMVFRYDNTGHHKKLNLPTYPGHKHEGREDNVVPSISPDLAYVLQEIESILQLPLFD